MTLKSLNIRYAKLIRKMAAMVGLVLATVSLLTPATLNAARIRQDASSVLAPLVTEEQKLIASDGVAGDEFGLSIALSGSTMVVGAAGRLLGNSDPDSVYAFERRGASWVETQKLTASDGVGGHSFGFSVALSGSTIVVGAPFDPLTGNIAHGSAYVFNRQGGSWTETQKLTASDGAERDLFGWSVALSGSTIIVGAPNNNFSQGAAYV